MLSGICYAQIKIEIGQLQAKQVAGASCKNRAAMCTASSVQRGGHQRVDIAEVIVEAKYMDHMIERRKTQIAAR